MAARQRRLDGLRPPERDRRNVPGDRLSEPLVSGRKGVREGALLEVGSFAPAPVITPSSRRAFAASR